MRIKYLKSSGGIALSILKWTIFALLDAKTMEF